MAARAGAASRADPGSRKAAGVPAASAALYRGGRHYGRLETVFPYNVPAIPARKGNGRVRALVESMVQSVRHRVLLPLQDMTFFAPAETIRAKPKERNDGLMSTWRVSRRPRFEEERPFLRPVPEPSRELRRMAGTQGGSRRPHSV